MTPISRLRSPAEQAARAAIARWSHVIAREARRLCRRQSRVSYEELVADGRIDVVEAERQPRVDSPDEQWRAYICIRVRGAMADAMRRTDHLTRSARRAGWDITLTENDELAKLPSPVADPDRRDDACRKLAPLLDRLQPRDRRIVEQTYLLGRYVADVARDYGVSPARIAQIRARALRIMREVAT